MQTTQPINSVQRWHSGHGRNH